MQIFIKSLTGGTHVIDTNTNATVRSLWRVLYDREGVTPERSFRLTYGGKQLEPERFLYDYGIQKNATLFLLLRLSGGAYAALRSS